MNASDAKGRLGAPRSGKAVRRVSLLQVPNQSERTRNKVSSVYTVMVDGDDGGVEMKASRNMLLAVLKLRDKYKSIDKGQCESVERLGHPISISTEDGIIKVGGIATAAVSWEAYYDDVVSLIGANSDPHCQAACRYRLQVLEEKYKLYKINNSEIEESLDRYRRGGGVFANTTKVDNNIKLTTSMNAFQLLQFIQRTVDVSGDEVVQMVQTAEGDKKPQTLREMLRSLDVENPHFLTVEGLGLHPSTEKTYHRFDVLDPALNRAGKSSADIVRVFLSRTTVNDGLFFAEAVRPQFEALSRKASHIEARELQVDVTGTQVYPTTDRNEWDDVAKWLRKRSLFGTNSQFFIRLPRMGARDPSQFEFHQQHIVERIFLPLFIATLAPEDPKNADIAWLLNNVGGFVIDSEEDAREFDFTRRKRPPAEVPWSENVCDLWFAYYVWGNLCSLNAFRKRLGLNTFQLRAHAGERSSQLDPLLYSFLLCDSIHSGLALDDNPVLQFLYGAQRIGIAMSPLCNNALHVPYMENPFPRFFCRGLNVALSTDSPLHYHHSAEALQEEYGTACKLYKLSGVDMCEIAYNSVLISAFPTHLKEKWLGERFAEGPDGNSLDHTNVPTSRLELRQDMWRNELQVICPDVTAADASSNAVVITQRKTPYAATDTSVEPYPRVFFAGPMERDAQHSAVAALLHKTLELRKSNIWSKTRQWTFQHRRIENAFKKTTDFNEDEWMFKTVDGVIVPHEVHHLPRLPEHMHRFDDFRFHVQEVRQILDNVHVKAFCVRRLELLEHKFRLHLAVNHSSEAGSTTERASQNRDFYQATKVDTNVRMEAGMTARQLLNFIIVKANNNGDDIVAQQPGREPQTLRQLMRELNIDPNTLTVDDLNVQVDTAVGNNAVQQYTPEGRDVLLGLLLKTDNQMKGRYFAELTKLTFDNFKRDRFTFAENRLPIYGASNREWEMLSQWFDTHGMACMNNQWMIQIPRIYGYLRKQGRVKNFAQYLENIFNPLWDVSLHPSKFPRLFHFVNHISGFDCVGDERAADVPLAMANLKPQEWTSEEDPPYNYYLYHIWANICTLNDFRFNRNFSTFSFRPSCGEAGSLDHVIGGFLLANAINYGVRLRDDPALQYLFFLAQIGVSIAPLSNNTKVLNILDNPLPHFFRRGLNISLSTDAPLLFHSTHEPLLEEYSIASKVWKLSPNDLCEIARNSVLQSGFDHAFKQQSLGKYYFLSSSRSNDTAKTHLSDIRVAYRYETYHSEINLLEYVSGHKFTRAMFNDDEELVIMKEVSDKERRAETKKEGIIVPTHDGVDLEKLRNQRALMMQQMDELNKNLDKLKSQNKMLSDKLQEEIARDQQAQQLRIGQAQDTDSFRNSETSGGAHGDGSGSSDGSSGSDGDDSNESGEVELYTDADHTLSSLLATSAEVTSGGPKKPTALDSSDLLASGTITDAYRNDPVITHVGGTARPGYVAFASPVARDRAGSNGEAITGEAAPPAAHAIVPVAVGRLGSVDIGQLSDRSFVGASETVRGRHDSVAQARSVEESVQNFNQEINDFAKQLSRPRGSAPPTTAVSRRNPMLSRLLAPQPETVRPASGPAPPQRSRTSK